jgi:cysteine desulfurase/selenocysteine lyase
MKNIDKMLLNTDKIRPDFPVLQKQIKGKPIIYFDNACYSLKPIQVIDKINEYYKEYPACGGRSLHKLGKRVDNEVSTSRKLIKKFFNARSEKEIVFTKNTTEGINLIANSLDFKEGDIILTTNKEHNSNLLPWQRLVKHKKIKHEIIDFDNIIEDLKNKINKNVKLISIVHSSNLDGTTIPAKEVIKIAHENDALVLLDAAQSAPHKEINVRKLDVDFLACSGHKMLGPSGTGILYSKYHLLDEMKPFLIGGETVKDSTYDSFIAEEPPEKFEAGLQNYAGIIGLSEAVRYLMKIGRDNINKHEIELNKKITVELISLNNIELIGPEDAALRSGIFSFNIKDIDMHSIALMLDESQNIMLRSGAHCVHSWFNAHNKRGSARASLYLYNTKEECDVFVESVKDILKILK